MLFELLRQIFVRPVIFTDKQGTCCIPVNSVDDTGAQNAVYPGKLIPAVIHQGVHKRVAVMSGSGMHDHAFRFVYNQDVRILVQNVERNILRFNMDLFRLGDRNREDFSGFHLSAGFRQDNSLRRICFFSRKKLYVTRRDLLLEEAS